MSNPLTDEDIEKLRDLAAKIRESGQTIEEVLRAKQQQPLKPEQLQLPGLEVAPALRGRGDRARSMRFKRDSQGNPYCISDRGRRFDWHQPVTTINDEWYLWVCQAMPAAYHCGRRGNGCEVKGHHYHCFVCSSPIGYGDLHGGSEVHVCLECLKPRMWGKQEYPEYDY